MENTILTFLKECDNQLFEKIVKAFAAYGWGWGGEGKWSSGALDYMHFSLRGT